MDTSIKLKSRDMFVAGRYNYSAVDADGGSACIVSGISKKLAASIIGYINQGISEFLKLNRLATMLANLEKLEPAIKAIGFSGALCPDEEVGQAARDLAQWITEHRQLTEDDRLAYLSLDQERYADEAIARRGTNA